MFLFTAFDTYNRQQVEKLLDTPLLLPEWMTLHHSVADVDAVFLFQMHFIATREGVIIGIETGISRYNRTEFAIFEKYLQKNKCDWCCNGGDVWELDGHGQRLDVVMQMTRLVDHRGYVTGTRHIFERVNETRYLFENVMYRRIEIDSILTELNVVSESTQ